jgi:hypothetical protein
MALIRLDLQRRPLLDGAAFGDVGAYHELRGEAEFAVDPDHPLNQVILDLDREPRDADGRVHFSADVRLLQPADPSRGNRGLFLDVVNRGRSVFAHMLEPGPMTPSTGITRGFLLRRGFTIISCGWQHDIPRGGQLFGLSAPFAQEFGAPVTGVGFMALRDLVACLRDDGNGHDFAIALGASQSGRLLRQMVYLGMCESEDGHLTLDGVLAIAAGARMTEANLRFGEPSSNGPRSSVPPFTDAGLLQRARERERLPKVFHLNTSSEYCSSAALEHVSAAMCHAAVDTRCDIDVPDNVRIYLCASTQHAPAALDARPDGRGMYPPNTIDYKPFVRAAVDNLTRWVTDGTPPPPSAYPRFADGTLTPELRPAVDADGNEVAGLRHPDVAVPLGTYRGWNPSAEDPKVLVRALGATIAFAPAEIWRRYGSREHFLAQIRAAADALAADRYVLAEDVDDVLTESARRWERLSS